MKPLVSFVVPCYKLAHLLPDCIHSILAQSFKDFEILIMDDCSPDDTPEVARSFQDPRVKHIRNSQNLRHLRNYNEGIRLSQGKYIWLISADDCLRDEQVLEKYVRCMEENPRIGYSFCPAIRLEDGREKELLDYSVQGPQDAVWNGRKFLQRLVMENTIVAPTAMARKECYEKVSMFPLDMPWAGDWYLWCVFALHYDVAYFAEPMVCYRRHALSMTNILMFGGQINSCSDEDIELPWNIKQQAAGLAYGDVVTACRLAIAKEYARSIATRRYLQGKPNVTIEAAEESLHRHAADSSEERWIRARMYAFMGTFYYWQKEFRAAHRSYGRALKEHPWMPKVLMQYLLLSGGGAGIRLREALGTLRARAATRSKAGE